MFVRTPDGRLINMRHIMLVRCVEDVSTKAKVTQFLISSNESYEVKGDHVGAVEHGIEWDDVLVRLED